MLRLLSAKPVGLEAVFSEVFPIESYDGRSHLEYVSYNVTARKTEIEAIREGCHLFSFFVC